MPTNTVTDVAAAAAVASPIWLPQLHQLSEAAALILPIFGVLWIAIQIGLRLAQVYTTRKAAREQAKLAAENNATK